MAFISNPGNTGHIVLRLDVQGEAEVDAALLRTRAKLAAIAATNSNAAQKLGRTTQLEQQLRKEITAQEKAVNKTARSLIDLSKSTSALGAMGGGLLKILKLQSIEFGIMTVALGALRIALVAGRAVMKAFHASLTGLGAAAGVAVAAISAVLGAMQQLQIAQMKPMFASVYASLGDQYSPQGASRSATGLTRNMMGDARFGMFSEKALQQVMSARLQRGQQVGGSFRNDLARYGDYTGGDEKALTAISEAMAEAEKRGKITAEVYSMLVKSSPAMKAAFEEIAGGEKQAAAAAQSGRISFQQFHKALIDGNLKSLAPYKGALDEINKTVIGRFKGAMRTVKAELAGLSMTSAKEAYGFGTGKTMLDAVAAPIEGIKESLVATITAIGPALRNVAPNLFNGIDGVASHLTERLTFYIVKGMDWLDGFSLTINRYIGNIRNFFARIGQYLTEVTDPFSRLWQTFVKPLIKTVLGSLSDEFRSFGDAVDQNMSVLKEWAGYLPAIREGFKAIWEAGNVIKRIMTPIVTLVFQFGAAFGGLFAFAPKVAIFVAGVGLLSMAFKKAFAATAKWRGEIASSESTLATQTTQLASMREQLELVVQAMREYATAARMMNNVRPQTGPNGTYRPSSSSSPNPYRSHFIGSVRPEDSGMTGPQFQAMRFGQWQGQGLTTGAYLGGPNVTSQYNRVISRTIRIPNPTPLTSSPFSAGTGMRYTANMTGGAYMQQPDGTFAWTPFTTGTNASGSASMPGQMPPLPATFRQWASTSWTSARQSWGQRRSDWGAATRDAFSGGSGGLWGTVNRRQIRADALAAMTSDAERQKFLAEERIARAQKVANYSTMGLMMIGGMVQQYGGNHAAAQGLGSAMSGAGMGGMTAQMLGFNPLYGAGMGAALSAGQTISRSTPKTSSSGQALGGALSGAGLGAAIGTAIAPGIGTAVGGAVGAVGGMVKGLIDARNARDDARKAENQRIVDVGAGGGALNATEALQRRFAQVKRENPGQAMDDYYEYRRLKRYGKDLASRDNSDGSLNDIIADTYQRMKRAEKRLSGGWMDTAKAYDKSYNAIISRGNNLASEFSGGNFFGFKPERLAKYAERHHMDLSKTNLSIEALVKLSGYSMDAADSLANWAAAGKRYVETITGFLQTGTERAQAGIDRRRVVAEFGRTAQADRDQGLSRSPEERLVSVNQALDAIIKDQGGLLASGAYGEGDEAYQRFQGMVRQQMFSLVSRGQERFSPEMEATLQKQVQSLLTGGTPDNPGINNSMLSQMAYNPELVKAIGASGNTFVEGARGLKGQALQDKLDTESMKIAEQLKSRFGLTESKEQIAAELKKKLAGSLTADGETVSGKILKAMQDGASEFASYSLQMSDDGKSMRWKKGPTTGTGGMMPGSTGSANVPKSGNLFGMAFTGGGTYLTPREQMLQGAGWVPSAGDPNTWGHTNPVTGEWETTQIGDTATSRFGRTVAAHAALTGMVPGRRFMTSGLRNYGLGSPSSDHLTGRAYDLVGDHLGTYAKNVNAMGGFAEFHGSGGSRHLHVVPPIGDTSSPVGVGGGGTHNYSIVVNAPEGASPAAIANEVMARIARKQRDSMERA